MTERQKNFGKAWRERMSALRNLPPVLTIVWRSGPLVVALGLVFRLLASLQPLALLYVSKLIIDSIVTVLSKHQAIPTRLWWLVAAEFLIAVLGNVLTRVIDYLDSLLADKYTRHVSIQVMKHAAERHLGVRVSRNRRRRQLQLSRLWSAATCVAAGRGRVGRGALCDYASRSEWTPPQPSVTCAG